MKATRSVLALCLPVLLGVLLSGCAAGMASMTCLPGEPSVNCCVKKFPLSPLESCGIPAPDARSLLQAMEMAGTIAEEEAPAEESAVTEGAESQASPAAPEPPDCKGQDHHIISRPIAKALERHKTLRGLYKPRDKRFMTQGKDEDAHCGYQKWHRDVDQEVIAWLERYGTASREEFEAFLRSIYSRSGLRERFPRGF